MNSEIYVLGATGQVGGEIQRIFPEAHYLTRSEIDLSDLEGLKKYFENKKPKIIVNCSAYTQVDLAEKEEKLAHAVNAAAPGLLAGMCEKFIHFSTDYVFSGDCSRAYLEDDAKDPQGIYGKSKLEGEKAVLAANPKAVIIRTSWVYSDLGKNFVKTMLRFGKEKEELRVVSDQIGSPTYAKDLGQLVVDHGLRNWNFQGGVYHYSNEGVASWYDFAWEIMRLKGLQCRVTPIKTADYPTPAKRPAFSLLDKTKIKKELGLIIPHWKESLAICLQKLS
ncbi:MAG TPA: dTDP-4-dehydrorhamnose reductase [Bacteriovoracaceae bacterium]|nr:dTDP-4-dehydrorhamnose reductase [Bacteriovoracaceae bacterium]